MNCPKCNKPMSQGYIKLSSGSGSAWLNWMKEKRVLSYKDPEYMEIASSSLFSEYIPAFHCTDCKQITFSYDERVNEALEDEKEQN